jgi:hypothetical protein
MNSPLGIVLIIFLVIILLGGGLPHFYHSAPWGPGYGWGNGGIGLLGVVLIIVVILALTGYL